MIFRIIIDLFCILVICVSGLYVSATQKNLTDDVIFTDTVYNNFENQFANNNYKATNKKHKRITYISKKRYIVSGILGTTLGGGTGHAAQGRWKERGWLFAVLDLGSIFSGIYYINQKKLTTGSFCIALYYFFRVWEAVDVWYLPSSHKIGMHKLKNSFYITPVLYSYNDFSRSALGLSFGLKW